MPLADTYRFTFVGDYNGSVMENVLHFKVTAVGGGAAPTTLTVGTGLLNELQPAYLAMLNEAYTLVLARCQLILPVKTDPVEIPAVGTVIGDITGDGLPAVIAAIITWRTGVADRKHRGRSFIPAQSESQCDESTLAAGQVSIMDTFADACVTPITVGTAPNSEDLTIAVLSRELNQATVVTNWISRNSVRTMRSRTPGRGI